MLVWMNDDEYNLIIVHVNAFTEVNQQIILFSHL